MALTHVAFCRIGKAGPTGYPALNAASANVQTLTPSGTHAVSSVTSANVGGDGTMACRVSTDTAVYASFGTAPNSGTDTIRFYIPAGATEYFLLPSTGLKISVIAA